VENKKETFKLAKEHLFAYEEKADFLSNSYSLIEREIKNQSKKMDF